MPTQKEQEQADDKDAEEKPELQVLVMQFCAPNEGAEWPLLVGDVTTQRAAVSVRVAHSRQVTLRLFKYADASKASAPVEVPAATTVRDPRDERPPTQMASAAERELGIVPLLRAPLNGQQRSGGRVAAPMQQISLRPRAHDLRLVAVKADAKAADSVVPLARYATEGQLAPGQCYLLAVVKGASEPLAFHFMPDACPRAVAGEPTKAKVRLFAPPTHTGGAQRISVRVDGFAFKIKMNGALSEEIDLDAGEHRVSIEGGPEITRTLESGFSYTLAIREDGKSAELIDFGNGFSESGADGRTARVFVMDGLVRHEPAQLVSRVPEYVDPTVAAERTVHFFLDNLEPDAHYVAQSFTAKGNGPSAHFRTPPASASATANITFGLTGCLGDEKTPFPSLSRAASANLDFMIFLGDTVYADGDFLVIFFFSLFFSSLFSFFENLIDLKRKIVG